MIVVGRSPSLDELGLVMFIARVTGGHVLFDSAGEGIVVDHPHQDGGIILHSAEDLRRLNDLYPAALERAIPHLRRASEYAREGYYNGAMRRVDAAVSTYLACCPD